MRQRGCGARVVGQDSSCAPVSIGAFWSGAECPAQAEARSTTRTPHDR